MVTVLFDVDEVLYPVVQTTIDALGVPLKYDDVQEKFIAQLNELGFGPQVQALWDDAGFWAEAARPFPEFQELLDDGTWEEFESTQDILYVTQPWPTCKGWLEARKSWFLTHVGEKAVDRVIPIAEKWRIRGDFLVDDMPHHCIAMQEKGEACPILWRRPWNCHITNGIEVWEGSLRDLIGSFGDE
jgi:hypothetical protein